MFALFAGLPHTRAASTERIVVDRHAGLAIGGYDPRGLLHGRQAEGREPGARIALRWRNLALLQRGNRAAFAAQPEVYVPQFGAYDPVGVARGVAVAGNPDLGLISGEPLFLFYDHVRLERFAAGPERVIAAAGRKWPDISRTLSP